MKIHPIIRWTPRILSVLLIFLLFLLSLDVFESDEPWYKIILGFLIHNIPTTILLVTLIIAWKHPWVGSVVFMLAGMFYAIMMFFNQGPVAILSVLTLSLPGVLSGVFFGLDHYLSRKNKKPILNVMI